MKFLSKSNPPIRSIQNLLKAVDWLKLEKSLLLRGMDNNINFLHKLVAKLESSNENVLNDIQRKIFEFPNYVHPRVWNYGNKPKEVYRFTPDHTSKLKTMEFSDFCRLGNNMRMDHLGNYTGHKSYYLFGKLAELEQALVQYTIDILKKNSFSIISVPDILPKDIINACGMHVDGDRTQVYKLESGKCLSGTAEMAIAGFFANKVLKQDELPLKFAAVSRCFRAETSSLNEEKGIYRVHQFTKVEMFCVCSQHESEDMVEELKNVEMNLFKSLNLKFRVLDMPPTELGDSAYQKYDIEAWMPGRNFWGEISSCSNCTDYQSKRLNITYIANNDDILFAHTVNGTASAIPRLLISLVESNQCDNNTVKIPDVLQKYIRTTEIAREKALPEIKLVKHIKQVV